MTHKLHQPVGQNAEEEFSPVSDIEKHCRAAGLKMTPQRRVILRVLSELDNHLHVEELYRLAAAMDPKICRTTVYRTVRLFEAKGLLSRLNLGRGRSHYEPSSQVPHYHIIDVDTGIVTEFHDDELEASLLKAVTRLGFESMAGGLELFARRNSDASNQSLREPDSSNHNTHVG
jgi:Fur family transcriptional regulator, ferric uptake regulator